MNLPDLNNKQKRVVIVGAGFAGLELAKTLSSSSFQIVIIDKNNYHQFQPLLYQVATSGLEPSSVSFPLRKIFQKKQNTFVRITEVTSVEPEKKTLNTTIGNITYDFLVLAQGAVTNFFNNAQLQQNAFSMKSISEALLLRNTLLENYEKALNAETEEQKKALLNVVIVGGGPTGVELAGAIAELKSKILPKDYSELNFNNMHIYLLEAAPKLLGAMSSKSGNTVELYLKKMGVDVSLNTSVTNYDGENVLLSNGNSIKSNCLIWSAGVKGNYMAGINSECYAPNNRLLVDEYNKVKNTDAIFALGDAALMALNEYPKGHPQVAPVAIQQAKILGKNLQNIILNKPLIQFIYKDKGSMATVGKNKAVVEINKLKFKGYFAWATWMFVHLMSIVGVKNKLFVLLNWIWHYFTYDPSLRIILRVSEKQNK